MCLCLGENRARLRPTKEMQLQMTFLKMDI